MGKRGPGAKPARAAAKRAEPMLETLCGAATRAERVIGWLQCLSITSGAQAGQKLALRPWQRAILEQTYAEDATGRRPVRTALISMGRKGGKTTLSAALALCHLCGPEAVPRGQIVSAAADRAQAAILYAELRAFALADQDIADRLIFRDYNKTAEDVVTGSTFKALSADHRKAHGLSPTVAICDEVAQWRGRELLDALRTGQGAHAEPLLIAISTRSPDPDNPLEELIGYGNQVADGTIADPTFLSAIFSAPPEADPWNEATWRAANPDADEVRIADIRVQAMQAQKLPSMESSFRAFVLNQPIAPDERFIGRAEWDACSGEAEPRGPCFAGLDLASGAADLSAFALYWPETGALRVWAFLPELQIGPKEQQDRAPYRDWQRLGYVVPLPGKAIDRVSLLTWIAEKTEGLELAGIACDRWGLSDLQAVLEREGLPLSLRPHGAGFKDQSPSIRAFEQAVLDGTLRHGGNALLRWSVANAVIDTDPAGNRKLAKDRAKGRIDPLVAAVTAVGLAAREPAAPNFDNIGWMAA